MQNRLVSVLNLVRDLNLALGDNTGEEILCNLVGEMVHSRNVDLDAYFKKVFETEWVRHKVLMDLRPRLNTLAYQINVMKDKFTVNSYSVSNLGATFYGEQ
jgi:hypothetical protein